jgi:hypothetical protein
VHGRQPPLPGPEDVVVLGDQVREEAPHERQRGRVLLQVRDRPVVRVEQLPRVAQDRRPPLAPGGADLPAFGAVHDVVGGREVDDLARADGEKLLRLPFIVEDADVLLQPERLLLAEADDLPRGVVDVEPRAEDPEHLPPDEETIQVEHDSGF